MHDWQTTVFSMLKNFMLTCAHLSQRSETTVSDQASQRGITNNDKTTSNLAEATHRGPAKKSQLFDRSGGDMLPLMKARLTWSSL